MPIETAHPFEQALIWLKGGRKITRQGWNGKGMFIYLKSGGDVTIGSEAILDPVIGIEAEGTEVVIDNIIYMRYANRRYGIWTPTHEDILAKDWNILV